MKGAKLTILSPWSTDFRGKFPRYQKKTGDITSKREIKLILWYLSLIL